MAWVNRIATALFLEMPPGYRSLQALYKRQHETKLIMIVKASFPRWRRGGPPQPGRSCSNQVIRSTSLQQGATANGRQSGQGRRGAVRVFSRYNEPGRYDGDAVGSPDLAEGASGGSTILPLLSLSDLKSCGSLPGWPKRSHCASGYAYRLAWPVASYRRYHRRSLPLSDVKLMYCTALSRWCSRVGLRSMGMTGMPTPRANAHCIGYVFRGTGC